jgi:hypothetical protein
MGYLLKAIGKDLQAEYMSGEWEDIKNSVDRPCVLLWASPGASEVAGFLTDDEARECLSRVLGDDTTEPSSEGVYDITPEGSSGHLYLWADSGTRDEEGEVVAILRTPCQDGPGYEDEPSVMNHPFGWFDHHRVDEDCDDYQIDAAQDGEDR